MSFALNAEPLIDAEVTPAAESTRIWVTWEKQRRNATISRALGCKLFEFNLRYGRIRRYTTALVLTLRTFLRERPSQIFVQNPSIVLAAFAVAYGRLFRIPVIVDTHNAGVQSLGPRAWWEPRMTRFILRWATLTILSNQSLADATLDAEPGIAPIAVLPDPIPVLERPTVVPHLRGRKNILFVCSWAEDEPYLEVIEAGKQLPPDVYIYITGRSKNRLEHLGVDLPPNVVLTGFLTEEAYIGTLYAADVIIDLTTREDCLVCGAYEAVSAERTVILSGTAALKSYFRRGALYTDNTSGDLVRQIGNALSAQDKLSREVRVLKKELVHSWEQDKIRLEQQLGRLAND
jgi:hypothetical protein